jgi:hypothetical protein
MWYVKWNIIGILFFSNIELDQYIIWIKLENIILNEKKTQTLHIVVVHVYEMPRIGKFTEAEHRM